MIIVNRNEYIEEEHAKTLEQANKAIELYRQGKTVPDVAKEMGCSVITIRRYFRRLGGVTRQDEAIHQYNRFIK